MEIEVITITVTQLQTIITDAVMKTRLISKNSVLKFLNNKR